MPGEVKRPTVGRRKGSPGHVTGLYFHGVQRL
jgi:hypothetical protein